MSTFARGFGGTFRSFGEFLKLLPTLITRLSPFLRDLLHALKTGCHRPRRDGCRLDVPPGVLKRPDPMLYSQQWLMKQGLAVTWDNPDIQLQDALGNPVPSSGLTPDTDYKVVVRIWNNSYDAPAPGLPVSLSFLSFGMGTVSTPVGQTSVDLGVKGSPHCPAFASFVWHTPALEGHYCLQALLVWPDDANPENNLGQENTNVGKMHSPAEFKFPVHNRAAVRRRFQLEADMYRIPAPAPCSEQPEIPRGSDRYTESRARWAHALRAQAYGRFPVTADWRVAISPAELELDPGETRDVMVSIERVAGAFSGTQAFNIHGFASPPNRPRTLVGGVTLYVEGS